MAKGYPDYLSWSGRAASGETLDFWISPGGAVGAEGWATIELDPVPSGYQHILQALLVTTQDDKHWHRLDIYIKGVTGSFVALDFITGGIYELPGVIATAGQQFAITIYNYSDSAECFNITLFWTVRKV